MCITFADYCTNFNIILKKKKLAIAEWLGKLFVINYIDNFCRAASFLVFGEQYGSPCPWLPKDRWLGCTLQDLMTWQVTRRSCHHLAATHEIWSRAGWNLRTGVYFSKQLFSYHSVHRFTEANLMWKLNLGIRGTAAAAAATKSRQSCPTPCDPIDGSPPGSAVPGILQARTLEWVAISFHSAWKWKVKVKSLSLGWVLETPWTAAHQAPLSMGFSRQEYWSGVPLPSP